MRHLLILCFWALAGLAMAASPDSFHQGSRSNFVKLDYVSEQKSLVRGLSGEDLARQYLKSNAPTYGLQAGLANLELREVKDSLVGTHYYFQQNLNGYRVHQAEIIVSISHETGGVYQVFNNTWPMTRAMAGAAHVALDADDALDVAWTEMRVHGEMMAPNKADLVYLPSDSGMTLAYLVDIAVEAPFGYFQHQVDAATGKVMDSRRTSISRIPKDDVDFAEYTGPITDRAAAEKRYQRKQDAAERSTRGTVASATASATANGSAQVFDPDPVTALQNSSLSDSSPASAFSGAYVNRTLQDINQSGSTYSLSGPWVNIANFESPNTAPSTSSTGNWSNTRGNNAFNDVMTYFHIDQNQRYMQSLGFTGSTGIQYGSIAADSDGVNGDDNSHFIPSTNRIAFGHGCVDDNEDAFVILHEYGHAIHFSINNNWSGGDTGGMGEGFGDYWAGSYRYRTTNGASFNPAWAFPWDGHNSCWGGRSMDKTNYQYDPTKSYPAHATVGGVYSDELWSTPLFQAMLALTGQGVDHDEVDQIILQAHFGLGSGVTMREMASAIVSTAQNLYPSGPHASVFQSKFEDQNILEGTTQPPTGDTELNNGDSLSGRSGSASAEDHYFIQVPAGASNLSVAISGGSGDVDLYLRYGSKPTTSSYDCRPYQGGNNENCAVASPQAGTYYIMLRGYSTYSGVTLSVSYQGGGTNQAPNAAFSRTINNLSVSFTDGSSDSDGSITSRSWNFGDGATSTSTNPSHTYASAGTYTVTLTVTDNGGLTDSTSSSVTVTAPDPDPTPGTLELFNGQSVGGQSAAGGEWVHYKILVPENASNLVMSISGGSGDADLYTRFGQQPTTSAYDCRPYKGGNSESCTVDSPNAGEYFISVRAYSSFANLTVVASYDDVVVDPPSGGGWTQTNLSGASGSWQHFTVTVPSGVSSLAITMSGGSGDGDMYVRFGAQPTTSTWDYRPYNSGNNETVNVSSPQAGTWHVSIRGYSAYSGVTLTTAY